MEHAAALCGLAELALSGCTTVFDHHYVFPRGVSGLVEAEIAAARELGVRIVASRGSMDLGESDGGLPPDSLVEDLDTILADTERLARARRRRHGADRGRSLQPVLGHDAADEGVGGARPAARAAAAHAPRRDGRRGRVLPRALRLHAGRVPRARRLGRTTTCGARTACTSRAEDVATFAVAGVGVAHCPTSNLRLGAGVAPVRELLDAGARVGLGVDGTASNERGDLFLEVKSALLVARGRGGPAALTAREALALGDARRRRRAAPRRRRLARAGQARRHRRLAHGRARVRRRGGSRRQPRPLRAAPRRPADRRRRADVVRDGALVHADEQEIAREHRKQAARLWQ